MLSTRALTLALILALFLPTAAARTTSDATTSFEELPVGELTRAECALGTLRAESGHAEIDGAHAHSGDRCLRLFGGEARRVELVLAGGARPCAEISFRAERWTSRDPFEFFVEVRDSGGWREIFRGDDDLRVGARFLSHVTVPMTGEVEALRFTSTAPEGTGVLIDDLELVAHGPLVLESLELARPVLPVLVGNDWNPIARLDLDVSGTEGALALERVVVDLTGTTEPNPVRAVALFQGPRRLDYRDPRAAFEDASRVGEVQPIVGGPLAFDGALELSRGETSVWIAVALSSKADLDARIRVRCPEVRIGDATLEPRDADPKHAQRLGVALRSHGDDGSSAFRIPGLVTTNEGTLIAVYDVRWRGWGDLPGDIDVALMRSTDGGRSWGAQQIVMDLGDEGGEAWLHDGVGDPAVLVDRATNAIHVIATWSHGNRAWRGSGPGLEPDETGQLLMTSSRDDGLTFGPLRNLTRQVKDPAWCYLLQGPGRGITMGDGTLVFPAQYQAPPDEARMPHSTVIYSLDHGATWQIGTGAKPNTTESAVVELEDGVLMLNMRDNRGGSRAIHTSSDMGRTWVDHPTTRGALVEPVCMASLIHVGRELDGRADGRLVFSNPNVGSAPRRRMSLQASVDFGATWLPEPLLLDEGESAGYSCLAMIDAETVGVLYEGSRAHMTFQRVPLVELFGATRRDDE